MKIHVSKISHEQSFAFTALYSGPCKEAARRAEKEAEERRQKEQEERSWCKTKQIVVSMQTTLRVMLHLDFLMYAQIVEFIEKRNLPNVIAWGFQIVGMHFQTVL